MIAIAVNKNENTFFFSELCYFCSFFLENSSEKSKNESENSSD